LSKPQPSNPFLPVAGETVHFRKKAWQCDLKHIGKESSFSRESKEEVVVEAVGEVLGILGDGRMTISMTSFQDDKGKWISITHICKSVVRRRINMNIYIDDVDL
jgi:hypothetical protein